MVRNKKASKVQKLFVSFASIIYTNIHLRKMCIIFIICMKNSSNNYYHAWNFYRFVHRFMEIRFFIIISEFLTINLIKSLILRHRSSYFFIFSLLSLVESNKCSFPLISSYYSFALLKIRYKGLRFTYFESLIVTYPIQHIKIFLYNFSSILILSGSTFFILIISLKKQNARFSMSISLTLLLTFYIFINIKLILF